MDLYIRLSKKIFLAFKNFEYPYPNLGPALEPRERSSLELELLSSDAFASRVISLPERLEHILPFLMKSIGDSRAACNLYANVILNYYYYLFIDFYLITFDF